MPHRLTIEHTANTGTLLRVTYEPAADDHVRIIDWRRKPKGSERWQRVKHLIGLTFPREQIERNPA